MDVRFGGLLPYAPGDRGHRRQAHTAASHRIEHPLRDLQEPSSWVLIDTAPEHSLSIPGESFVDRHSASVPRMPRVTDFSRFITMGVALSTCTTRTGHISAWARRLRVGEFARRTRGAGLQGGASVVR